MTDRRLRVAIVGASGYTGAELVRLLTGHPTAEVVALTADRKAGQGLGAVFPHLAAAADVHRLPTLTDVAGVAWDGVDAAFCGLPHGTTQEVVAAIPSSVRVIDLSADFRLSDTDAYAAWYGQPHRAPALQKQAVYGLTELARDRIAAARLIACPGCYPTSALLPLVPLVKAGRIDPADIIIDSKSGVSGAGRALKEASLFAEVAEGVHAYGLANHRHLSELEQELGAAAGRDVRVTFTPHLIPMNRGILSTIYVRPTGGAGAGDLRRHLADRYAGEPFVRVLPEGQVPATRHVRGSNHCLIGVVDDRVPGRVIILSVIDNLVKGAAGQAVQNFNVAFGMPESAGLTQPPLFP
ncbi:MAG: N-acetyl-gamma-glutamyl-phosphate reductase [Rhodospirillales bacterium]|nr:MAG: N-acetyl-gamma-glutamyl-phosphate reductase [Rhodospirillales bacterium]